MRDKMIKDLKKLHNEELHTFTHYQILLGLSNRGR